MLFSNAKMEDRGTKTILGNMEHKKTCFDLQGKMAAYVLEVPSKHSTMVCGLLNGPITGTMGTNLLQGNKGTCTPGRTS